MPRLAWFSPLPPARGDCAVHSVEALPRLAGEHQIDAFSTDGLSPRPGFPAAVLAAREFEARHVRAPYDLVVYHLDDSVEHDFVWRYLGRYPGLVVLHDVGLHRSRSAALLSSGRADHYRAEFAYDNPEAPEGVVALVEAGFGRSQFAFWPMVRAAVASARLVAVPNGRMAASLAHDHGVDVATVRLGVTDPLTQSTDDTVRERLAIPRTSVVFVGTGSLTRSRRIPSILQAFRTVARSGLPVHLLLAGQTEEDYDPKADAAALGLTGQVTVVTGAEALDAHRYLAAGDVALALRWPATSGASRAQLEAMAAGRAVIVTDLAQEDEVARLDPRSWRVVASGFHAVGDPDRVEPACVAIDIVDEVESLRVAMRRLAVDPALRERLGRQARRHWQREHTLEVMVDDYRGVIASALLRPDGRHAGLPAHLSEPVPLP